MIIVFLKFLKKCPVFQIFTLQNNLGSNLANFGGNNALYISYRSANMVLKHRFLQLLNMKNLPRGVSFLHKFEHTCHTCTFELAQNLSPFEFPRGHIRVGFYTADKVCTLNLKKDMVLLISCPSDWVLELLSITTPPLFFCSYRISKLLKKHIQLRSKFIRNRSHIKFIHSCFWSFWAIEWISIWITVWNFGFLGKKWFYERIPKNKKMVMVSANGTAHQNDEDVQARVKI